jgi:hypothetical protein
MKQPIFSLTPLKKGIRNAFVLSILAVFFAAGCAKGPGEAGGPDNNLQTQTTTLFGIVTDESGAAVSGVTVTAGLQSTTTDVKGIYLLKNATVPKGRAVVLARKAGYFTAARAGEPGANGTTRIELRMMANTATYTVDATSGGTVNVAGGASVSFDAGSFVTAGGASYSGTVKIAARYLSPSQKDFFDYFPGDNAGQSAGGGSASLISNGFVRIELTGTTGEALKLATGKQATISYPKLNDAKAPSTTPLWYFDESLGMWKEDGSATLTGGNYVGKVSHFTDWNLDYMDSSGTLSMRVVCNGIPTDGVVITIVGDDGSKYFVHPGGRTGPDGTIRFRRFPAGFPVQIDIRSDKNNGEFYINTPVTVTLNPGETRDIGDVSLNSPCPASITGTLTDCDGKKTDGLVTITYAGSTKLTYTKTGDYALSVPSAILLQASAFDGAGNASATLDILPLASGEQRIVDPLKICGTNPKAYIDIPSAPNDYVSMAFSPDGTRFAVWSYQTGLSVYESKSGNKLSSLSSSSSQYDPLMEFSADNTKLMVSNMYSDYTVYDVSALAAVVISTKTGVGSAHLYDDGTKVIAGDNNYPNPASVSIYLVSDGSLVKTIHPAALEDSTSMFGYVRDEDAIIYADMYTLGTFHVWSVASDKEIRNFTATGSSWSLNFSQKADVFAMYTTYPMYACYDSKDGNKLLDINLSEKNGSRSGMVALTTNYVYTGALVDSIQVVQGTGLHGGLSVVRLLPSTNYAGGVAASRGDEFLAAYSGNNIRVWQLK